MSTKPWQKFLVFESMVAHNFSMAGRIWVTILLISSSTLGQLFKDTWTGFLIIFIYSVLMSWPSFILVGFLLLIIDRYSVGRICKYLAVTLSATLSFYIAFVVFFSVFLGSSSDWITLDIWNRMPRGLLAIYLGLS
ncbi:MAG: hypothetical protein JKY52_03970, partial [Flavobacteriales bacterium]|nr:hypothetical protein [Flavobacteriales bacterium]